MERTTPEWAPVVNGPDGPAPDVVAAGAVLWRPGPDGRPEVAIAHRPRYDDWSLPKGKLDRGETPPAAAVRELAEETGFAAQLGPRLGEVHYQVPEGRKVVHYWSARAGDGGFTPGDEVDRLRWLEPGAAHSLVSYPHDREVLRRFVRLTVAPVPVLLVRHAKAGSREAWTGDDTDRPLSERGRVQAERLAALLALFGPRRVHAAPPLRCVQTVEPLARRLDVPVVIEPLLGDHRYPADPCTGLARLLELTEDPDVAVVCSQGAVIPDLVRRLTGVGQMAAPKASTWVLGLVGGRALSADHYPPPG